MLIDSRFSTVICAPVYSSHAGLSTQVPVGVDQGLKHDSSIHCDEVISLQQSVDEVRMDQALVDYIIALSAATREHEDIQVGISPRGAQAVAQAARATAILQGRDYCVPEDIVSNVLPVSAHRVISKTYMHDGDTATTKRIMQQVLETVPSPA